MVFMSRAFFNYRFIIICTAILCLWHFYTGRQQSYYSKLQYNVKHTPSIFATVVRQTAVPSDVIKRLKNTWLKRVDSYQFFSPFAASNDSFRLPGGKFSQRYGPLYSWLSHWIVSMEVTNVFSFFIYTFDDAYVIVNNLRKDLATIDSEIPTYSLLGNCSSAISPTIVLSRAAVKALASGRPINSNFDGFSSLTDCLADNQATNLCTCFDKFGLKKINLETDYEGKLRYFKMDRHFSRQEISLTKQKHGYYWDGKEAFNNLSSNIIAFLNVNPLEQTILDTLIYRLNKHEL
uniref:Uncharacterized protein n=1 Tax=Panagrolaimus superbus TaxID=310955 RepID=A0A914YPP2_9BILA